jgi:hypothetical protein
LRACFASRKPYALAGCVTRCFPAQNAGHRPAASRECRRGSPKRYCWENHECTLTTDTGRGRQGNNGETLFREQRNYPYFLKLYAKYIEPVAETYAYCLLKNHFRFLVRIRVVETGPVSETGPVLNPSRQFNNLFIAYAKVLNKAYQRTDSFFDTRPPGERG